MHAGRRLCKTNDTNMTRNTATLTPKEREALIESLFTHKYSCVIRNGDEIRVFRERGVKDLYRLLRDDRRFLDGAFVADKVVGKAAAALMILGGVREVFADVASRPAVELLRRHRVRVSCTLEVPHIINRTKTGWCPLETRCHDLRTPQECYAQIEAFMNQTSDR